MAVESAADRAVFFNAEEFGVAASYTPPGGSAAACTILRDEQDRDVNFGNGRPMMQGRVFMVRASEIAAPVKGGIFTVASVLHTIVEDPKSSDIDRLIWRCTVR